MKILVTALAALCIFVLSSVSAFGAGDGGNGFGGGSGGLDMRPPAQSPSRSPADCFGGDGSGGGCGGLFAFNSQTGDFLSGSGGSVCY